MGTTILVNSVPFHTLSVHVHRVLRPRPCIGRQSLGDPVVLYVVAILEQQEQVFESFRKPIGAILQVESADLFLATIRSASSTSDSKVWELEIDGYDLSHRWARVRETFDAPAPSSLECLGYSEWCASTAERQVGECSTVGAHGGTYRNRLVEART